MPGFVSIVGAGPGDPELLTLAGRDRLERAEVVVADYLVNPALLLHCPEATEIHQRVAGPRGGAILDQPRVNALLIDRAQRDLRVVRLKGGDPCMFGRGGEEAQALRAAGVEFEFVPGVSSPIAAPLAAGIPVTHRDHTPAVTFVSGYEAYEKAGLDVAWEHLAKSAGTLVLMMSVKNARLNARRLIDAGRDPSTPAAVVRWGTRGIQRTIVGRLDDIADQIEAIGLRAPSVLIVGEVVNLRQEIGWFERRPLFGRRVVVTRPRAQASELMRALGAAGADAVAIPSLAVEPPHDLAALDAAVAAIPTAHDGVMVTSPNGVAALFSALERGRMDGRALAGKLLAVVGASTAEACRSRGLAPDLVPDQPRAEGLAEALAQRQVADRRWLHVRADQGGAALERTIAAAGGTYTLAIGYRTTRPTVPEFLLRTLRPAADGGEGFDVVTFASGKAAGNFVATCVEAYGDARARRRLAETKVVTIGPVTTRAVSDLGLRVDAEAEAPSDAAIVAAVIKATS